MWVDWEENPEKRAESKEKSIHELKAQFVYLCVREKKYQL